MAYGDIHNKTGTICKAKTDASCPLADEAEGGHSSDLGGFARYHGVDEETFVGLVENARMAPKAALELMGSGQMTDTPPPLTKKPAPGARLGPDPQEPRVRIRSIQEQVAAQSPEAAADLNRIRSVQEQVAETPKQRYERELQEYKVAMVHYENRQLEEYNRAVEAAKESRFAPQPKQPPFRTVYPKSFAFYDDTPKDYLPEELPTHLQNQPGVEGLWEEYLRKRKQLGDVRHARGDAPDRVLYL